MNRALILAKREYLSTVMTKGFLVGLIAFPILMSGSVIAMTLLRNNADVTDRRLAIIDHTAVVIPMVNTAASERNTNQLFDEDGKQIHSAYIIEEIIPNRDDPQAQLLALSDRVRSKELYAFVEIGEGTLSPSTDIEHSYVRYYSKNSALDDTRAWFNESINNALRRVRAINMGVDKSELDNLFSWIGSVPMGLVEVDEGGDVKDAERISKIVSVAIPLVMCMMMFMMIMMGAIPLLNSVMEEKAQRIAEVLLGSVTPFEFMLGKILGGLGVSLTSSLIYVVGGAIAVSRLGYADLVPYEILPWFFAYMVGAIFMIGSIMAAIGAAVNDVKEAQTFTLPAMIPIMIPMFILVPVLKEPLSSFSTGMSLFPFFTPMLMTLRISSPADIPAWQPYVGLLGILLMALLAVWSGARVFRVGILMQGKQPKFRDLFRWAIRG